MSQNQKRVLGIVGATKCNLNCSYCFLHKNPAYLEEDKKVMEALRDGSFLKNIKKTLNKLKIKYDEFNKFEIWGAETSLHIAGAREFFISLVQDFPCISEFAYSTNFLTNINNHLELIKIIEEYGVLNEYRLPLQISVDGPDWILAQTRRYKYQELKDNVLKFIDEINKMKLYRTKIDLRFKATLPWNIFEQIISSKESLEKYYDFWYNENIDINSRIINGNLTFGVNNGFIPSLVYPDVHTKEDGLKVLKAAQIIDYYGLEKKYHRDSNMILDIFGFNEVEYNYDPGKGCGKYVYSLLFKHDGSLAACSNGILDTNEKNMEWLKENDHQEYIESLRTRPYSTALLPNGDVDYDYMLKHYKYMQGFWEYHTSFVLTNVCSQIYDMSYAGLISSAYYKDPEMIYRHALYIMRKHGCYFTNLRYSGNAYCPSRAYISLVCNGLLEYYEQRKRNKVD